MADQTSAASLPGGSVVVDDLKGIAFYAVGDPGEDDRWVETTAERSDLAVDYALRHGGEVVRVGDDTPGAAPVIRNEDLTAPERAALDAWMRGSADTTGMLYAVRAALDAERKHAERGAARMEAARRILATDVGPDVRMHLIPIAAGYAPDARERLARHLYLQANTYQSARAEAMWNRDDPRAQRDEWLAQADTMLAVITGKSS